MYKSIQNRKNGFTLLYSLLVVSAVLSIALVVGDIILRELTLSSTVRDSQIAFYAADTGAECALYWDKRLAGSAFGDFNVPSTIRDDLVGHWKLDQLSGLDVPDSGSESNDGIIAGGNPDWRTGIIANALEFYGADYVNIDDSSQILGAGEGDKATLAAWVKKDPATPYGNVIHKWSTYYFLSVTADGYGFISFAPGDYPSNNRRIEVTGTTAIDDGGWHHIAGMWDGGTVRLYVDGVLEGTASDPYPRFWNNPGLLQIGAYDYGAGSEGFFDGYIDDVRIYKKALGIDEIKALALLTPFTLPVDEGTSAGYMCNGEDINDETTGWDDTQGWIVTPQGDGASVWFDMEFSDGTCASVTVTKEPGNLTTIDSRGYNTCEDSPRRVERGLRATF